MNKKLIKHAASFLMLLVLFAPVLVLAVPAGNTGNTGDPSYFPDKMNLDLPTGGNNDSAVAIVTNVINVVLGLLGLIAVIIILIGGFKWMTAQGSDDKVTDAKKTITYGLVGLAIVLLAYVIVKVVINAVYSIGSGNTRI